MAIFYRGAGLGTYWYENDPRISGFLAHSPGTAATEDRLTRHICRGTVTSPYISLTRSYGVALAYAMTGKGVPTDKNPAYVWEIEISDPVPTNLTLIDPIQELAKSLPGPTSAVTYQHDGPQNVILGLVDPAMQDLLVEPCPSPPGGSSPNKAPNLTEQLQTLVFALRDSEILAIGAIPKSCISALYEVY